MADFTALKTAIQQYIAQNGNKEITGNLLQTILLAMVQSMGDQAINGVLQMLSNEMIARENQDGFLGQALTAEQQRAIAAETKSAELVGETKTLVFKNAAGQPLYQVSVASLVSNGLVDVEVDGTNLVMTFHTDSGNEEITIPICDIFNPSNYYTKTQIDGLLSPITAAITNVNSRLNAGYFYLGLAVPETIPTSATGKFFYIASQAGTYHFMSNDDIPIVISSDGLYILSGGVEADDWLLETIVTFTNNVQFNNSRLITSGGVFNAINPINELLHRNYILAGVADTTTIPTDYTNVFYLAGQGGTYTHFLNGGEEPLVLPKGLTVIYRGIEDDGWNYWVVYADNDFINTNRAQALTSNQQTEAQNNMVGKSYAPAQFSGLGKKMLAKNMQTVGGVDKNVMTQAFFEDDQGNALTNTVFVIQYDYEIVEDISIPAGGVLQFDGGSIKYDGSDYKTISGTNFYIYGNGTKFENICIFVSGNNNVLRDFTIFRTTKSQSPTMIYQPSSLVVNGNGHIIQNVESYNQNGPGIFVSGKDNKIYDCYCHDNITGMLVGNTTRNIIIKNSRFVNNNVNNAGGADGIMFNRTVIGVVLENCELSNNGEHGIYFQGQNAVIKNNRVFGNGGSGLKFGCYEDQGYAYPGETLDCWVPGSEGVPGYNGVLGANGWGMKNIFIVNNIIGAQQSTGSGIYFQPSVTQLLIDGNVIKDSGIRIVFFNYTGAQARLEAITNITISNNKLENCNISGAANEKLVFDNNVIDGNISVYCSDATVAPYKNVYGKEFIIRNNVAKVVEIQRADSFVLDGNTLTNINWGTNVIGTNKAVNNKVSSQTALIGGIITVFSGNNITMAPNSHLFTTSGLYYSSIPTYFADNYISSESSDQDNFINDDSNISAEGRIIKGNVIICNSYYAMRIYGVGTLVENNTIINSNSNGIRVYGSKNVLCGNFVKSNSVGIQVSTDSYHIIKNNIAIVDNTNKPTNIVSDNVSQ